MKLKKISIKNFRAIRDLQVEIGAHTIFIGSNGVGKSCILKAVDKFFSPSSRVEIDDFHERNVADPIEIALTFNSFSAEESERFGSRIHADEMTVVRVFLSQGGASRYYGMTLRHAQFQQIRAIEGAAPRRTAFMALPREGIYADLPAVANAEQLSQAMEAWEHAHIDQCALDRDDGQFLGFANVGRGSLTKHISFVFVPAVRDAIADAVDGRGSVISQLIEILVRNVINQKEEILAWQKKATDEYKELTSPEKVGELNDLSGQLNETLKIFYADAGLDLRWLPIEDLKISLPTASVELLEQGFVGPVEGKGHGLQRAFIFTILQHLAQAIFANKAEPEELVEGAIPAGNLILAIEEPELYQHPTKQRHLAGVLRAISSGNLPGVMSATQLLVCSHSPHFVSTDDFDEVRLARRVPVEGSQAKECVATDLPYQTVLDGLNAAHGPIAGGWQQDSLKARLHTLNAEVAEGFFALKVVLVEGVGDQAAILAIANAHGFDLSAHGIAVVQVSGKNNLDKPLLIFRGLGIPTYVIWDNDLHPEEHQAANIALMKINGVENPVDFSTQVTPIFACFDSKLETVLRNEIGEDFDAKIGEVGHTLGMKAKELKKNPVGLSQVLRRCYQGNNRSATMDLIVAAIRNLQ